MSYQFNEFDSNNQSSNVAAAVVSSNVMRTEPPKYQRQLSEGSECFSVINSSDAVLTNWPQSQEDEMEEESNSERVKLKLMSLWNNVKYGWLLFS